MSYLDDVTISGTRLAATVSCWSYRSTTLRSSAKETRQWPSFGSHSMEAVFWLMRTMVPMPAACEARGVELAQQQIGIGHRGTHAAAAVAGRARFGTRALRARPSG